MRRRAPRPLAAAIGRVAQGLEPPTLLARAQACWAEAVGELVNEEAQPVSERDGELTSRAASVWAELKMMGPVCDRLNAALGDEPVGAQVHGVERPPSSLVNRVFTAGDAGRRGRRSAAQIDTASLHPLALRALSELNTPRRGATFD